MPPIESLGADSDYAQFLSPKVSEELRRLALRKLFHRPEFNVTDGLDDNALDFRDFTPLENTITADMRHRLEREAEEMLARAAREPETRPPGGEPPAPEAPAPEAGAPTTSAAPADGGSEPA